MQPSRLTTLGFWVGLVALVATIGGLGYLILWASKSLGGLPAEAWRILVTQPFSLARLFAILALCLFIATVFVVPISLLETRSLRAYARLEAELRAQRPEDAVTPYHGAEGDGVAFDGPLGRALLLRAERGIGEPRLVTYPPVTEAPPASAVVEGEDRTSPMGS